MRLANIHGRSTLLIDDRWAIDIERASNGVHGADPMSVFDDWDDLAAWAAGPQVQEILAGVALGSPAECVLAYQPGDLGAPVPAPRQIFAIALNYLDHVNEVKGEVPASISIFTKFVSAVTGPYSTVVLPLGDVDWEIEIVAVISRTCAEVSEEDAWDYVAGLTVGQDLSERISQLAGRNPQFSLAKSHKGFAPMGPALVTTDELSDPNDLELEARLNGVVVQTGNSSQMVFSIASLISQISQVATLLPGDLIFTGTPGGVGMRRTPQRFLTPGDELVSRVSELGEMRTTFQPIDERRGGAGHRRRAAAEGSRA